MVLEQSWGFFESFFRNPSVAGIGIALLFGAVWLACYGPPLIRAPWLRTLLVELALFAVAAVSAFLTLAAICWVQIPLQTWVNQGLGQVWSPETITHWAFLAGIPAVLISGLVQEGAKLVPALIYMRVRRPAGWKAPVVLGAIAGAGFGIFEAQWALNSAFAAGWSWGWVQLQGWQAVFPFWERFFAVCFHIASTAIVMYGFARGRGWQVYLLVSFMHAFLNYSAALLQSGLITTLQAEVYIALWALLVAAAALWLRWRPPRWKVSL